MDGSHVAAYAMGFAMGLWMALAIVMCIDAD